MQKGKKFLSDLKLYSDYFKWRDEIGRYENWKEACADIINGHRQKYSNYQIEEYLQSALESMEDQVVLASQRNLQYRHTEILRHNTRMYNCTSTHIMRNRVFQEIFYLGLSGCGVGGGLLIPFVNNLSRIQKRVLGAKTFVVPDSIEGWADSLGVLLSSYFVDNQPFPEYAGYEVKFDYSQVREKGTFISGGFKAPGPDGLKQSLEKIEQLIERWIDKEGNKIRPILAFDIICHASDAVLSGGVRRSALNMIVDPNDTEMIHAKTGNWREENPQRARSNNSVLLLRGKVTKDQFDYLVKLNDGANDIGFVFANSWFDMFNPCFEILKLPILDEVDFSKIDYEDVEHYVSVNKHKFGIQGCVSYETKLITKDGIEMIGKVVDENREVEIWNGENWSKVKPILTGTNRKLFRVKLNDGSYLDCTENHKWLVKNRFEKQFKEIETKDLIELLKTTKYKLQVPRSNVNDFDFGHDEIYAYDYGFVLGDGTCPKIGDKYRTPFASVYESNFSNEYPFVDGTIGKKLKESYNGIETEYYNVTFNKLDKELSHKLKYEDGLPSEIFSWSKKSILAFIAGWIDTDGTITYNNKARIYGEENKIRDLQLLLTKIGVNSTVNLCSKKGEVTNFGTRNRDVWYVQISDCGELWSTKTRFQPSEVKYKGKYQCIDSIVQLEGFHNSYCFEEQYKHQGLFNNVLTKQCNLSEINAEKCTTKEKFFKACKDATILGTLQAGYNSFPYLGEVSEKIFAREALLGVSITGWMNNPMLFNAELLKEGAEIVKKTNKELAEVIDINQAARTTCVKPSGNASVVLGTASGIHPEHSEKYFRVMQLNKESNTAKWLVDNMDFLLEDSVWSQTKSDYVVFVPVENPKKGLFKKDMKGIKHLELIKLVQQNWVNAGTNPEKCIYNPVNHNTSCTVIIDDKDVIVDYIWDNKEEFTAVSFMSDYGDKDFNQAPFTSVLNLEELVEEYGKGAVLASGLVVDGLHYFDNNLWLACDTLINMGTEYALPITGTREQVLLKKYWLDRAKKFAKNYFKGDMRKMVYCLKDVHLFHKWETVTRQFKEVNFGEILDKPQYKDIGEYGSMACSGSSCEITRI
jgi:hypothetical protein